jgi:hypothetical protein
MSGIKDSATATTQVAKRIDDSDDALGEVQIDPAENEDATGIDDPEVSRRRALSALTPEEEKKLLRRIDWHLMPLCSLIFMFKNLDVNNVRNESKIPGHS